VSGRAAGVWATCPIPEPVEARGGIAGREIAIIDVWLLAEARMVLSDGTAVIRIDKHAG
jgi:hypothetical protein